jgi:hypothetical protein
MDDQAASGALPDPFPARNRDNGLTAAAFLPLLVVDARLTADVLAMLATGSIAAFARPRSAGVDEVFSDAGRRADARSLLALRLPAALTAAADDPAPAEAAGRSGLDLDPDTVDAAFASIVAGWDLPPAPGHGEPAPPPPAVTEAPRVLRPPAPGRIPPVDPAEDHYVPPPVPQLPPLAPITRWALIGITAGILALVLPVMIGLNLPVWTCAVAVLAIVGGGGVMIARMGGPGDHGGDDGAVV